VFDAARAIEVEYGYEYVQIGDETAANGSPLLGFRPAGGALMKNWMESHHRTHSSPLDRVALIAKASDAPEVTPGRFAAVGIAGSKGAKYFAAEKARRLGGAGLRNPVVADYLVAG
jgi:hypothetical protein